MHLTANFIKKVQMKFEFNITLCEHDLSFLPVSPIGNFKEISSFPCLLKFGFAGLVSYQSFLR